MTKVQKKNHLIRKNLLLVFELFSCRYFFLSIYSFIYFLIFFGFFRIFPHSFPSFIFYLLIHHHYYSLIKCNLIQSIAVFSNLQALPCFAFHLILASRAVYENILFTFFTTQLFSFIFFLLFLFLLFSSHPFDLMSIYSPPLLTSFLPSHLLLFLLFFLLFHLLLSHVLPSFSRLFSFLLISYSQLQVDPSAVKDS